MHVLRAAPSLFKVGFAATVAYRAELIVWILTATLPLVMLALWNAVAADGPVGGLGQADLARYFAATLVVRQLTGAWVFWELNQEIRSGELSGKLLRPLNPLWVAATTMLAALPLRVLVLLPVLLGLAAWRPELAVLPSPAALGLFAGSCALAWCLNFLVQSLFGVLAFWYDQADGLFGLWLTVWSLLSGYVAPLVLFPEWSQGVLAWLPFRGMLSLPVELLAGFLTPAEALPALGVQLLWVLGLLAALRLAWRRGLARYGAFGS